MSLFLPITKVDARERLVYGTISEEVPDKHGEILDYASSRPAFEEWSQQFRETSGGKSLGNVRAMHSQVAAGKLTDIQFDDAARRIDGVAKIVDDGEWNKVLEGVYTGFSIGGGYARRWPDADNPDLMRYTPVLAEISIVDNPAVPTATFQLIRQDGSVELRKLGVREGITAPVEKALRDQIDALRKRIAQLEAQPMPAKGVLRAVGKSDDQLREVRDALAALSPAERAKELMRIALANPIPM